MDFPVNFIAATAAYSTLKEYVPAPYMRKKFSLCDRPEKASLLICGLGFYDLWINGKKITKGPLAPYISAPDDLIYYDEYEISSYLTTGDNIIGICLGNGMQNNPGGYLFKYDKAKWRGAPQVALRMEAILPDGVLSIESDESFLTAPSPIYFDDLRNGEYYDARKEIPKWNLPDFDDSDWTNAITAPVPRGKPTVCLAEPIAVHQEIKPVSVTVQEDGVLYDFGINTTGVCRQNIKGESGQTIMLYHGELLTDGKLDMSSIHHDGREFVQKNIYIFKGGSEEVHTPVFTYHGFRYVFVKGMTKEQATLDALTYLEMYSDLEERGGFNCSDQTVNGLQEITRRSTVSNFFYFPTDCPHREKNGWTADVALSAEHILLNLGAKNSFREWMRNIRAAQFPDGAIPSVVPYAGDVKQCDKGPAWDCVLAVLPYTTYLYSGDPVILEENATAILRYADYLTTRIRSDGLVDWGLGDWCPVGREALGFKSPVVFTSSVMAMDFCEKATCIFQWLGKTEQAKFTETLYHDFRKSIRKNLIDFHTMTAIGNCQTSQAMAIHYSVFDDAEKPEAFRQLLDIIKQSGSQMDFGVQGGRVLFHVLSDFGQADLAYEMITRPEFPSYGNLLKRGATTLWEVFQPEGGWYASFNHHFWGDISHWFIRHLAGICYNPHKRGGEVDIRPRFVQKLDWAQGFHIAPEGRIDSKWSRENNAIRLELLIPESLSGYIYTDNGYIFEDGLCMKPVKSGTYIIKRL